MIKFLKRFRVVKATYQFYSAINHNIQIGLSDFLFSILYIFKSKKSVTGDTLFRELRQSLMSRGIEWPYSKQLGRLNVVYASFPSQWEKVNIPEQIRLNHNLFEYYTEDRGIDISNRRTARSKIDIDFYNWIKELHQKEKIHLILTYFSGAEISASTIEKIKSLGIFIATFHLDDRLHFFGRIVGGTWSGPAAVSKAYDLNLTNSPSSLRKYYVLGARALFWPEAANPEFFKPFFGEEKKIDVLFIGAKYGKRENLVNFLIKKGINVQTFGYGWERGSLDIYEIPRLVSRAKIVLGFGFVGSSNYQCLKGRDFEFPSCGTCYLTSYNKDLESVYSLGKEILTYHSFQDCFNIIERLLRSPMQIEEIREKSREAILEKHTWNHRMNKILYWE